MSHQPGIKRIASFSERELARRVMRVVRYRLEAKGRKLETTTRLVDDLDADSLAIVGLTLALEEAFDIDIAEDEVPRLRTVKDAIDCVAERLPVRFMPHPSNAMTSAAPAAR